MCEMVKIVESNNRRLPTHRRHHPRKRMIQYSAALRFYLKRRRLLDARWSLSSGGHSADPLAGHDG
jgi:hypothetical protein